MDAHLDTTHVRKVKRYGSATIDEFLDNVDDLTKAIKDIEAPEIARVRAKVKMALTAAKSALSDGAAQVRGRARVSPKPRTATSATIRGRSSASPRRSASPSGCC